MQEVRGSNPRGSTIIFAVRSFTPRRGRWPSGGCGISRPDVSERARIDRYQPTEIEPRWQARWDELGLYRTDLADTSRPKFYALTMYDYPSGDLHIGHWYAKTPIDAIARFHRMHGENVFMPIGFDAFGLPAENAAIKNRVNPHTWTMAQHRQDAEPAAGAWAPRSTGAPRSSPASPSTTAGTSGSSSSSSRPAWPIARSRRSTGAPTTGRWPASRSRAPIATAGAAAPGSRSGSSTSGTCGSPSTPTSCSTSAGSAGRTRSGSCRRTGSVAPKAPR